MSDWELAQLNIAHLSAPLESPELADFVANLDRINALAEESPGFVWRLKDDIRESDNLDQPFADDVIVNLSVWETVDALHHYVYRTAHTQIMRRRAEWFRHSSSATAVLWWIPMGHRPSLIEAKERLLRLIQQGAGPDAFTFKQRVGRPAP